MDTRTLVDQAKARFNHNLAKEYLQKKYASKLLVAEQNGYWEINQTFISFLSVMKEDHVVLVDTLNNPVKVNRVKLLTFATNVYNQVMEDWHQEWQNLEKLR